MLTELHGKAGRVCQPAREGKLHCPLIVRPTSEDVVTGHLALGFRLLNPRWWLPDLVNGALHTNRIRRQVFRRFRVELWKNYPPYPRQLLPWDEGSTQVDMVLTWENPPTTVFIEAKYASELARRAGGDSGVSGFPSDQVIRNVRVGLLEGGWFSQGSMFPKQTRDFVLIVLSPTSGRRLVERYRDARTLSRAIPHHDRLVGLPRTPFVGEIGYSAIVSILRRQRSRFTRAERVVVDQLMDYLAYKKSAVPDRRCRQLPIEPSAPDGTDAHEARPAGDRDHLKT